MSQPSLTPAGKEIVDQIQENFIAYFRMFAGLPGKPFVEEDITWIAGKGAPGHTVLRTRLSNDDAEQRIDEVLNQIGQRRDHFDWLVFPSCRPSDLGERLVAKAKAGGPDGTWKLHGKIGGPGGNWMLANLRSLSSNPATPTNFHTGRVTDLTLLEEWRMINAEGFESDPESDYQKYYDAYARHGFADDSVAVHYIGYFADKPVTSATLLLAGGIASVYNVSTPPCLRRQGFGSAVYLCCVS